MIVSFFRSERNNATKRTLTVSRFPNPHIPTICRISGMSCSDKKNKLETTGRKIDSDDCAYKALYLQHVGMRAARYEMCVMLDA